MAGTSVCRHDTYILKKKKKSYKENGKKLQAATNQTGLQSDIHQTAEVGQVIDEVKQLTDVVRDGRTVGVHSL